MAVFVYLACRASVFLPLENERRYLPYEEWSRKRNEEEEEIQCMNEESQAGRDAYVYDDQSISDRRGNSLGAESPKCDLSGMHRLELLLNLK
jgi:hypothetical protein